MKYKERKALEKKGYKILKSHKLKNRIKALYRCSEHGCALKCPVWNKCLWGRCKPNCEKCTYFGWWNREDEEWKDLDSCDYDEQEHRWCDYCKDFICALLICPNDEQKEYENKGEK